MLPAPSAPKIEAMPPTSFLRLKIVDAMFVSFCVLANSFANEALRQCEAENATACRDCYELFVLDGIGHRRSAEILAGVEVPELLTGASVYGFEGLSVIAEEHQATSRGHGARVGMRAAHLGVTPGEGPRVQVVGKKDFSRHLVRNSLDASGIERLSLFKLLGLE